MADGSAPSPTHLPAANAGGLAAPLPLLSSERGFLIPFVLYVRGCWGLRSGRVVAVSGKRLVLIHELARSADCRVCYLVGNGCASVDDRVPAFQ